MAGLGRCGYASLVPSVARSRKSFYLCSSLKHSTMQRAVRITLQGWGGQAGGKAGGRGQGRAEGKAWVGAWQGWGQGRG